MKNQEKSNEKIIPYTELYVSKFNVNENKFQIKYPDFCILVIANFNIFAKIFNMNKYRIASLIIYPLIAIVSFCLFFFVKGNYYLSGYIDPLFFSGIMVVGCGLLTLMAFFGAFDFVVYGFRSIFKHMKRDYNNSLDEYPDYYEYSEAKKKKRKDSGIFIWPWLIIGSVLIISSFIIRGIVF